MAEIIDLAKVRAKKRSSSRGVVRATSSMLGDSITLECTLPSGDKLTMYMDLQEAEQFRDLIDRTTSKAKQSALRAHGIVRLAWCDARGRPIRNKTVRGRIVARSNAGVQIAIEPESPQQIPHEGWPQTGSYLFSGWSVDHKPGRRGWRVLGNLNEPATDG